MGGRCAVSSLPLPNGRYPALGRETGRDCVRDDVGRCDDRVHRSGELADGVRVSDRGGDLVHGMDCLRTIKYDGEPVLLLTNRPTDSGQDVTDRELQQSLDFILPRLPAATRVFCTQRRGMDPKPICQAVPQDPNRLASGSLTTHSDTELGDRLWFTAIGAIVLGGLAVGPVRHED